jgi:hypothetical protein
MNSSGFMKRMLGIGLCALVFAVDIAPGLGASSPTNAPARPADKPASKQDKAGRGLPFHGHVASLNKAAMTITMEGKKQRVFHVTADTKINKDKKPATLNNLMAGDYVGGYARERADGKLELVTLNITMEGSKPASGKSGK